MTDWPPSESFSSPLAIGLGTHQAGGGDCHERVRRLHLHHPRHVDQLARFGPAGDQELPVIVGMRQLDLAGQSLQADELRVLGAASRPPAQCDGQGKKRDSACKSY